jgi:hypothetical protein
VGISASGDNLFPTNAADAFVTVSFAVSTEASAKTAAKYADPCGRFAAFVSISAIVGIMALAVCCVCCVGGIGHLRLSGLPGGRQHRSS